MNDEPKSCDVRVDEAHSHKELIDIATDGGFSVENLNSLSQINYQKDFQELTLDEAKEIAKETCV